VLTGCKKTNGEWKNIESYFYSNDSQHDDLQDKFKKDFWRCSERNKDQVRNLSSNFRDLHENKSIIKNVTFWKYFFSVYYTFANCYRQSLVFKSYYKHKVSHKCKKRKIQALKSKESSQIRSKDSVRVSLIGRRVAM